jgi:UDP:flavonoid glycosyltransferase YjiC (YdhE family)
MLVYFSLPGVVKKAAELLRRIDIPTEAYLNGASAADLGIEDCPHIKVRDRMFKFSEAMPGKAIILHGGTLGTAAAAMYAGVPQVGLYYFDEQQANAIATRRAGIGKALSMITATAEEFTVAVNEAAASHEMRNYARQLSVRYWDYQKKNPYALAAERVLGLMRV